MSKETTVYHQVKMAVCSTEYIKLLAAEITKELKEGQKIQEFLINEIGTAKWHNIIKNAAMKEESYRWVIPNLHDLKWYETDDLDHMVAKLLSEKMGRVKVGA